MFPHLLVQCLVIDENVDEYSSSQPSTGDYQVWRANSTHFPRNPLPNIDVMAVFNNHILLVCFSRCFSFLHCWSWSFRIVGQVIAAETAMIGMRPNDTVEQHQLGCCRRDEGPQVRTTKPVLLHPTTCSSLCTQKSVGLTQDLTFVSEETIDSTNMRFAVNKGAALTFRAPAVKIAREVKRQKQYTAVTCRCRK